MKAQVLYRAGEPFTLEDRPDPVAGPGEAVARVLACGSGLTIQHVKAGRSPANFPIVIGHEVTGEIVEIGPSDGVPHDLAVGDAVTLYGYLIDGEDRWTRAGREPLSPHARGIVGWVVDGGYAEYVRLPVRAFMKLPEGLDHRAHPAEIGVIADALATPYKVLRRTRVTHHDTIAVFGAGGGVGIHQVMFGKWAHARVIAVDIMADKLEACRAAGADALVDASDERVVEQILELTDGAGVDVAVDYVSTRATQEAAIACLGIGGRFITLGGALQPFMAPAPQMLLKELELMGSRYCSRQEVADVLDIVARGEVWPLVTETYPLAEAETAHQRLEQGLVTGRAALVMG